MHRREHNTRNNIKCGDLLLNLVTVIILGVVLALVSSELLLRVNHRFGYTITSYKDPCAGKIEEVFSCRRPSALLGFENIPNCGRLNSYGLVKPGIPAQEGQGRL